MEKKDHLRILFVFVALFVGLIFVIKNADAIDNFSLDNINNAKIENSVEEVSAN